MSALDLQALQKLIDSNQLYAAAWRVIDARPLLEERKPIAKVDEIVRHGIKGRVDEQLSKIKKAFTAFIGNEALLELEMHLAETTQIDLHPDVRED